VPSYEQGE